MDLAHAARFGPYEILSALGAGGMGEVYRARDSKLKRDIAVKMLPQQTASDTPERRTRFERKAQSIATLNHPNIVTIHSVEEADGVLFLTPPLHSPKSAGSPPAIGTRKTADRPPPDRMNATVVPSGETRGNMSEKPSGGRVNCRRVAVSSTTAAPQVPA